MILSTNIAESSITIEGVVAVIDSGLARVASQAPWSGLPRLRVEKTSRASATQRAGRAGRVRAGRCLRLYTRADFEARPEHDTPEILRVDLAQARLDLAALGITDLPWLEPPPEAHLRAASDLLTSLGAIDRRGELTPTGTAMLRFAVHPRIARVVVEGERRGVARDACLAAAILAEGDFRTSSKARFAEGRGRDAATERSDLGALVDLFREAEARGLSASAMRAAALDPGTTHAVARATAQLERACRRGATDASGGGDPEARLAMAVLAGYPDRVAKRVRQGGRQLALATGGSAELAETSVVRDAEWLVALDAEERAQGARGGILVRLASAIAPEWLIDLFPEQIEERRDVVWNADAERVDARETMSWGRLVLHASDVDASGAPHEGLGAQVARVLFDAARAAGPRTFAAEGALDRWLERARFAASVDPAIAAPGEAVVEAALARLCEGRRSFAELRAAGLLDSLRGALGARAQDVDRLAPERVTLARGRSVVVRYEPGKPPAVASRIQDFFGMDDGPRIGGRVPVVLELLAPNGRAVQVTKDLAGFWERHYPSLRKELMRRYPKHAWPENGRAPAAR